MAYQTTTRQTPRRRSGASTRRTARPASLSSRSARTARSTRSARSTAASRRSSRSSSRSRGTGPASRRALASDPDYVQVQRLLDRFCDAFTLGDGRAAAECFAYPNLMVMGNGTQLLEDEDTVAGFFDDAPTQY